MKKEAREKTHMGKRSDGKDIAYMDSESYMTTLTKTIYPSSLAEAIQ